jgi:hypothetical protein
MNEVREDAGLGVLGTPWPSAAFSSDCLSCHTGIEIQQGSSLGVRFSHGPHVVRRGLDCLTCHTSHEDREQQGLEALSVGRSDCSSCHHGSKRECEECHTKAMGMAFETDLGDFNHEIHVQEMELECTMCHGEAPRFTSPDLDVCSACH